MKFLLSKFNNPGIPVSFFLLLQFTSKIYLSSNEIKLYYARIKSKLQKKKKLAKASADLIS